MENRQSNYELLRIVAIVLITSMHAAAQIGFFGAPISGSVSSFNAWLGVVVNAVGNTGVTCFVLISGYFGVKYSSSKFLHLVLTVTLYSLLLYFLFLLSDTNLKGSFVQALFSVPLYHNWFIICYLFLMLVAPYLNSFAESFSQRDFTRLLVILFVTLSFVPTLFLHGQSSIVSDGGKCISYFLFVYLFGRYLRIHKVVINLTTSTLWLCLIACISLIIIGNGIGTMHRDQYVGILCKDNSPLIFVASVCIFLLFGFLKFKSRFVNYVAKSILAVYILNDVFRIVDAKLIHLHDYAFSSLSVVMLIAEVLITFTICVIVDKTKCFLLGKCEDKIVDAIVRLVSNVFVRSH